MADVTLDFTDLDPAGLPRAVSAAHDVAERTRADVAASGDPADEWQATVTRLLEVHLQHESNRRLQAIAVAHTLPVHLVTTKLPDVDDPATLRLPPFDGLDDRDVERLAAWAAGPDDTGVPGPAWVADRLAAIRDRVQAELAARTGRRAGTP